MLRPERAELLADALRAVERPSCFGVLALVRGLRWRSRRSWPEGAGHRQERARRPFRRAVVEMAIEK
jgi:hypothetical protein